MGVEGLISYLKSTFSDIWYQIENLKEFPDDFSLPDSTPWWTGVQGRQPIVIGLDFAGYVNTIYRGISSPSSPELLFDSTKKSLLMLAGQSVEAGIAMVFVTDGPMRPEKQPTRDKRVAASEKAKKEMEALIQLWGKATAEEKPGLQKAIRQKEKSTRTIPSETMKKLAESLHLSGHVVVQAPHDAEQLLAEWQRKNIIDIGWTNDSDFLACGGTLHICEFKGDSDRKKYPLKMYDWKPLFGCAMPYPQVAFMASGMKNDYNAGPGQRVDGKGPVALRSHYISNVGNKLYLPTRERVISLYDSFTKNPETRDHLKKVFALFYDGCPSEANPVFGVLPVDHEVPESKIEPYASKVAFIRERIYERLGLKTLKRKREEGSGAECKTCSSDPCLKLFEECVEHIGKKWCGMENPREMTKEELKTSLEEVKKETENTPIAQQAISSFEKLLDGTPAKDALGTSEDTEDEEPEPKTPEQRTPDYSPKSPVYSYLDKYEERMDALINQRLDREH